MPDNKPDDRGDEDAEALSEDEPGHSPLEGDRSGRRKDELDAPHRPDRPPTEEEERAADAAAEKPVADPESVAEHEREMNEVGADQKGEGRVG